jgi:HSP20 family molecular chaperone IbpA
MTRARIDRKAKVPDEVVRAISRASKEESGYQGKRFLKGGMKAREGVLRRWVYATKPTFVRLREPLTDNPGQFEDVRILVDMRGLRPGDIRTEVKHDTCFIMAKRENVVFADAMPLPRNEEVVVRKEHIEKGILEVVLARKTRSEGSQQKRKERR